MSGRGKVTYISWYEVVDVPLLFALQKFGGLSFKRNLQRFASPICQGGEVAVKRALEEYVKSASFVLLRLKMRHHYGAEGSSGSSAVGGFKFFCMYAFLDKFVEQCPQVRERKSTCVECSGGGQVVYVFGR